MSGLLCLAGLGIEKKSVEIICISDPPVEATDSYRVDSKAKTMSGMVFAIKATATPLSHNRGAHVKSIKKLAVGLSALGLFAAAAPSFAAPALTFVTLANGTQTVDPFGGFDYISNATAVSTAPVFDGMTIMTTTYLASANAVQYVGGAAAFTPGIAPPTPSGSNPFEFTVKATILETATCTVLSGTTCLQAAFTAVGGSYDIYYDQTADANILTGVGFVNGTKIISGNILAGLAGSFLVNSTGDGGSGNFSFKGGVTFTETDSTKDAYLNPALVNTIAGAEIKIGTLTTGWTPPTSWVEGGGIGDGALVFQADGNQSFTAVPEPGTLALVGLSLVGLGIIRRRQLSN